MVPFLNKYEGTDLPLISKFHFMNALNKAITVAFALLISFISSFAQDVIVKRNGDEVKVRVLEVNTDNIKYKNFDNQSGPLYTILKSEIFMIKYENGMKEVITPETTPSNNGGWSSPSNSSSTPAAPDVPRKIEIVNNDYYQDGFKLSSSKVMRLIKQGNDTQAKEMAIAADKTSRAGKPLIVASIPLMAAGLAIGGLSTLIISSYTNASYYSSSTSGNSTVDFFRAPQIAGFSMFGIGAGCLVGGIVLKSSGAKKMTEAVEQYNTSIR